MITTATTKMTYGGDDDDNNDNNDHFDGNGHNDDGESNDDSGHEAPLLSSQINEVFPLGSVFPPKSEHQSKRLLPQAE
ncbi:hypothetical protein D0Y65_023548 [Glycine soja]|uniref:Uncharacterized protein n=1 Tax=Glycine soja TaxID=3848 RepID=A0A445IYI7_GLYSO|nr:hypothetical protein D0Y65_023548 [Glycine soja]